jgi:hypothetical protein
MKIALDYDETITEDHVLWSQFIRLAKARGHEVTIVTARSPGMDNLEIEAYAMENNVDIICTSFDQKAKHYKADIWIDDSPVMIPTREELEKQAVGCKKNGE